MADMDKQITFFHDSVQKAASRWGRKAYTLPDPELGDVIPAGLVVPVTIDCFVDGFLIGVTVALSPKAGVLLGAANVLEMGSLGMAYAVRLKNCTGKFPCSFQLQTLRSVNRASHYFFISPHTVQL